MGVDVLGGLRAAIDAVCERRSGGAGRRRDHRRAAPPARAAGGGDHPGGGGLRRRRDLGGRRGPHRRGVAGDALSGAAGRWPGAGCGWVGPCGTCPGWRRRGWPATSARPRWRCWPGPHPGDGGVLRPRRGRCWSRPAGRLRYRQFVRALAYWRQLADPDGAEDVAAAPAPGPAPAPVGELRRGLVPRRGPRSRSRAPSSTRPCKRIEKELFDADWAEAKARVGERVCGADLARTPAQRRADALVEMARRAMATPAGARLPEPLFTVLVGYETFAGRICELADGTVVSPGSLVPWLDEAWVERVVFDGPDRVKNVGVRRRLFAGRHPAGGRGAGPGVLPRLLRGPRRGLRDRPRRALGRRRAHHRRQRPGGVRVPQPRPDGPY